ncbi:hypothetical protein SAY87_009309 [Trapa incisa]|uniref:Uncharacterized protein n=1 Tax=Trapa incisa TaxID=236973 RepID=A0AAN7PWR1_9MYRT|nr:hypothetical protein SAY87_009309 [Trapa incisa]
MTVPHCHLLLLMAFLSLLRCNGRHLGTADTQIANERFTSSSVETAEKARSHAGGELNVVAKRNPCLKENKMTAAEEDVKIVYSGVNKELDTTGVKKLVVMDLKRKSSARHSRDASLVSVGWRVPHKKPTTEEHPGLTSDYSPPKTHPPSHN